MRADFVGSFLRPVEVKLTIPAPAQFLAQMVMPFALENTRKYYEDNEELIADLAKSWCWTMKRTGGTAASTLILLVFPVHNFRVIEKIVGRTDHGAGSRRESDDRGFGFDIFCFHTLFVH